MKKENIEMNDETKHAFNLIIPKLARILKDIDGEIERVYIVNAFNNMVGAIFFNIWIRFNKNGVTYAQGIRILNINCKQEFKFQLPQEMIDYIIKEVK